MTYTELFDNALIAICDKIDINRDTAIMINLPIMMRMIYTATSNAAAMTDIDNFAVELIFRPACTTASIMITTELAKIDLDAATRTRDLILPALIEVIGDLFND